MPPRVVIDRLTYRPIAMIWKEPEGYVARCSELGVASAGDSPSEASTNLKEANEVIEWVMLGERLPGRREMLGRITSYPARRTNNDARLSVLQSFDKLEHP